MLAFPVISVLVLLAGQVTCFIGHCSNQRKITTLFGGILYVVGGEMNTYQININSFYVLYVQTAIQLNLVLPCDRSIDFSGHHPLHWRRHC